MQWGQGWRITSGLHANAFQGKVLTFGSEISLGRSVSISVLFTFGIKHSCLRESYSVHWRRFSRISGLYPPVDSDTSNTAPPPVWTRVSPDIVNTTLARSRAKIRLGTESSSTLKYCLTHCSTHSTPSTRVQNHVFLLTSCVSLS